ncbi:VWA domain-containing protein [Candidatus Woesearchaeota archaeon]|nr:VWA domain-containing protein [Candidatus Woesearchaeota archaeon]
MIELTFTNPVYLWTLLLVPFIILTHIFTLKRVRTAALKFSNFEAIERVSKGEFLGKPYRGLFRNKNMFLLFLRLVVYTMLVLSVTGTTLWYTGKVSDRDFVLAIDTSTSMLADDFNVTRLEAAKEAARVFAESLAGEFKIGVVSFASSVFVDQELTSNKEEIKKIIDSIDTKESGGTNIGDTLVTSANLLVSMGSKEKAKSVILLTDGQSNIGVPIDLAIDYLKSKGVVANTVGIGTEEGGKFLGLNVTSKLDEETLKEIASQTNGRYFRARSKNALEDAFREIMSSTEKKTSLDISWILLIIALFLLAVEWVLVHTLYKTLP